jgi:hypothetical protein
MRWTLVLLVLITAQLPAVACDSHHGCTGGCVDLGPEPPLLRNHNDASLSAGVLSALDEARQTAFV